MATNDSETVQDAYRRGCSEWEGVAVAWREGLLKCKALSQNLQAENAALKARLAEAERVMREALKHIQMPLGGDGPARTAMKAFLAASSTAPPAAQGAGEEGE